MHSSRMCTVRSSSHLSGGVCTGSRPPGTWHPLGVSASVHVGIPPPGTRHPPWEQTPLLWTDTHL